MPGAERAQLGAVPWHLGPVSVSSQRFRTRRCPADSCPLKAVQGGERPRSYAMGGIVETVASVHLGKETYQRPELFLDTWSCFVLSVLLFCVQKGITETTVEGPGRQVLVHRRGGWLSHDYSLWPVDWPLCRAGSTGGGAALIAELTGEGSFSSLRHLLNEICLNENAANSLQTPMYLPIRFDILIFVTFSSSLCLGFFFFFLKYTALEIKVECFPHPHPLLVFRPQVAVIPSYPRFYICYYLCLYTSTICIIILR